MHFRNFKMGLLLLSVALLFVSRADAQVNLQMSYQCAHDLAQLQGRLISHASKFIQGYGNIQVQTPQEVQKKLNPGPTHDFFTNYVGTPHRSHKALFLLLPVTATHLFQTIISTYLDNPTPYFMVSKDGMWFAAEKATQDAPQALHLVVATIHAGETEFLHELSHLEDMEELYIFTLDHLKDMSQRLLVRADIFRIVTELRAYKNAFQVHRAQHPLSAEDYAAISVDGMQRDFIPLVNALSFHELEILEKLFDLKSTTKKDLSIFLKNSKQVPGLYEALSSFGSDVIKVVNK